MSRASDLGSISTRIRRIASLASEDRARAFTSLAYFIDEYFLMEAYARTRKDGASGVDGRTAAQYAENLGENLRDLLERFKSGLYQAPPVRRVHIPKGSGSATRPIGIPTFEDKVLQRAVTMVLEAIYEEDFLDCSYGFRPGRSAHDALGTLWKEVTKLGGGWVLDVDISNFFDELDHKHLRSFLDKRVRDGVIRRAIGKWLKAGVMESGSVRRSQAGTPQGGVISPLLANLYLHEVVDRWFEDEVKPRLRGQAVLVRYADDFVIVFADENDARRVLEVLPQRLGRFGLRLHPEKTRLVPFRRPPRGSDGTGTGGPGSFEFLGFTHFWGKGRQRGSWVVKRKTASSRFTRSMHRVRDWCRHRRHESVAWQRRQLSRWLLGHYAYYGITGNYQALDNFHRQVTREWRKWLDRRSQKASMPWERFNRLLGVYSLPRPKIVHAI
ncbi:MAG: group II intron reverse transcriptase/maturase [Thermoanaerobaculia bacterium]|nr:group II intron reverse transcriptase/maturase [Thermoanaerobaculia bacterium]